MTIRLRWAIAPLRRATLQAARSGADQLAAALRLRIDAVEVCIDGPLELQLEHGPSMLWRAFSSVFARELRRAVETRTAEALHEVLVALSPREGEGGGAAGPAPPQVAAEEPPVECRG